MIHRQIIKITLKFQISQPVNLHLPDPREALLAPGDVEVVAEVLALLPQVLDQVGVVGDHEQLEVAVHRRALTHDLGQRGGQALDVLAVCKKKC